jgi:hypothetical protein
MTVSGEQKAVSRKMRQRAIMIGRANVCLLVIALLFTVSPAQAQAPKKLPRIGYFSLSGGVVGSR